MTDRRPFGFYDDWIESNIANGTFTLLEPGVTEVADPDDPSESVTYRHVTVFSPLTSNGDLYVAYGVDQIMAVLMAIEHFNNRNPVIVPRLNYIGGCDIKFSWDLADTERRSIPTASFMLKEVIPRGVEGASDEDAARLPTAIMGAYRSAVSMQLAVVSGMYNITQVSFGSASDQLEDKARYPYFGRTIVGVGGIAIATTDFFHDVLDASHIFCIYVRDVFGIDFHKAFQLRASSWGIATGSASLDAECAGECLLNDINKALDALQESGFQYVYAILSTEQYETMMPLAYERGLAGDGNGFWLFDDSFGLQPNEPNSPLLRASHGSGVLKFAEDALLEKVPAFQEEWDTYMATDDAREVLTKKFPEELRDLLVGYEVPSNPSGTLFAYDAFMAIALSACNAQAAYGRYFSRNEFHDTFLASDFQGATERVRFDGITGTRTAETMKFHMGNYHAFEPPDEDGMVMLTSYSTHEYVFDLESGTASWVPLPGATEFMFSDNTTNIPPALPPSGASTLEIELWATLMGILAVIVVNAVVLGYSIWIQRNKPALPIASSQPFFLWMLAAGVAMMSWSLFFPAVLPYLPQSNANVACMLSPWFLSVGYCVAFAALFSKLLRIDKLFRSGSQLVRVRVEPKDVLKPFLVLLSLNMAILLTYSIHSPLKYIEENLEDYDNYGRPLSSYYTCNSDHAAPYRFALAALDIVAVLITARLAYVTRKVKIRYNESMSIFIAILLSSESFIIGIPGVIAAKGNPSIEYVCTALAVTWGCLGLVVPIFGPKVQEVREWEQEEVEKHQRREAKITKSRQSFEVMRKWNTGSRDSGATARSAMVGMDGNVNRTSSLRVAFQEVQKLPGLSVSSQSTHTPS
eukprot:Nitzschia sp. Nitz4//scaffold60_size111251//83901//86573//NITZ4_004158-RA/size111251-augustus-gene-0.123-mRNA-1//-1//CDS//3329555597//83//frame0